MEDFFIPTDSQQQGRKLLLISDALDVLYGKWKLRILLAVATDCARYKDILERNPGLTDKILSQNLRSLMADGLIERTVSPASPCARGMVEYRLTPHGASLNPVLDALASWGDQHRQFIFSDD